MANSADTVENHTIVGFVETLVVKSSQLIESLDYFKGRKKVDNFERGSVSLYEDTPEFMTFDDSSFKKPIVNKAGKMLSLGHKDIRLVYLPHYNFRRPQTLSIDRPHPLLTFEDLSESEILAYIHDYLENRHQTPLFHSKSNFPYIASTFEFNYSTKLGYVDITKMICHSPSWKREKLCDCSSKFLVEKLGVRRKRESVCWKSDFNPFESIASDKQSVIHLPICKTFQNMKHVRIVHKGSQGVGVLISRQDPAYEPLELFIENVYKASSWCIALVELLNEYANDILSECKGREEYAAKQIRKVVSKTNVRLREAQDLFAEELSNVFATLNFLHAINFASPLRIWIGSQYTPKLFAASGHEQKMEKRKEILDYDKSRVIERVLGGDHHERKGGRNLFPGIAGPKITLLVNYIEEVALSSYCTRLGKLVGTWITDKQSINPNTGYIVVRRECNEVSRNDRCYTGVLCVDDGIETCRRIQAWTTMMRWRLVSNQIERENVYLFRPATKIPSMFSEKHKKGNWLSSPGLPFSYDEKDRKIEIDNSFFPRLMDVTLMKIRFTKQNCVSCVDGRVTDNGFSLRTIEGALDFVSGIPCIFDLDNTGGFISGGAGGTDVFVFGKLYSMESKNMLEDCTLYASDVIVSSDDSDRLACLESVLMSFHNSYFPLFEMIRRVDKKYHSNPKELVESVISLNQKFMDLSLGSEKKRKEK